MTLFAPLFSPRASLEDPQVPVSSSSIMEFLGLDSVNASGKNVTEKSALGMPAVFRAVTVSSNVPAGLPLHSYRMQGDARVRDDGPAGRLLDDPHPDMTPFELWQTVYFHRKLWGNAYLRKLRNQLGEVAELWPVHPSRVKAGRTSDTGRKVYSIDGGKEVHTDDTLLHIPGIGYDGICGVSPVRIARQSIGLGLAAEEYGAKLFGSGSLATGILQTEQRLTQEQADTLHKRWKAKRSGLASAHETIVLDSGAQFHQLTIPPEDAQFLESRRFQVVEVCRWFGVPPFLMFETEKSTSWGTGLEQQALGWVMFDLRGDLTAIEQRITKMFRRKGEPKSTSGSYGRYSLEGLLRGDSAARAAFYQSMWNMGALSTNEIRAYEELAPVDGGDTRYRPLNMGGLGTVDTSQSTTGAPA